MEAANLPINEGERRFIRRPRPPPALNAPLEGLNYWLSVLERIVQFLSLYLMIMICFGIELRFAEMMYSAPWRNRTIAHPNDRQFSNKIDLFFLTFDYMKIEALQSSNSTENVGEAEELWTSNSYGGKYLQPGEVDEETLLMVLGEDPQLLIQSLTELRVENKTGLGRNAEDRLVLLNI